MMSFLKEVVKPTSIAILYESSDFGTSGAEDMVKQAKKVRHEGPREGTV